MPQETYQLTIATASKPYHATATLDGGLSNTEVAVTVWEETCKRGFFLDESRGAKLIPVEAIHAIEVGTRTGRATFGS